MERNSSKTIGQILGISINTRIYWIKKYVKTIKEKRYPNERVKIAEIGKLYSFIEITLVRRNNQQIVGYNITFDKSRKRIQNLINSSPKARRYYSDAYPVYSEILYDDLHISLKNKIMITLLKVSILT